MSAIFKREFKSYFATPLGFIIIAVFTFFSGMFFSVVYSSGSPTVEMVIYVLSTVALFAVPFITMRLISEDRRQKVDQVLLTAPVGVTGIVMGKFFAAFALFALSCAATLIYQLIVTFYITVNWLIYLYALFGILLYGAVLISIGMFISSLTESPVVSAALTYGVFMAVQLLGGYASSTGYEWLTKLSEAVSFITRFDGFVSGQLNVADIVYMLTVSALFVFLRVRSVEKRRWA